MTTIAYDTKTVACDSQVTIGNTPMKMSKVIHCEDGTILFCAGTVSEWQSFVRWWIHDRTPSNFPDAKDITIIIVHPSGTVEVVDDGFSVLDITGQRYAAGSGSDLALGAMAMGADAAKAVEVAKLYDTSTGGEVVAIPVPKPKPKPTKKRRKAKA